MTQIITACDECNGKGKKINQSCNSCSGKGHNTIEDTVEIVIPAGIKSGMQIAVQGKGNFPGNANLSGDLIVNVNVNSHEKFIRVHNDIHYDLFVSIPDAILGSQDIKIPLVDGVVKIVLEPGVESGRTLRISGKGMPFLNENRFGDFYVHVNVYIPKNINEEDKKYIEKLKKKNIFEVPPNNNQAGVFKKTNDFKNLFT
jgi:molecular chaperone DnaJ